MRTLLRTVSYVLEHPLNRGHRVSALKRYLSWQICSRLTSGKIVVPFVGETRLVAGRGMTGATGNIYCGLHEFQDMAFVIHALRAEDLFVDIGANVGSYSILAAGVAKAQALAIEPAPKTFGHLLDNIRLNALESRIIRCNVALGSASGEISFTRGLDTINHVVAASESGSDSDVVKMVTLDDLISSMGERFPQLPAAPSIVKIDVEGFEAEVLRGAARTLESPCLNAILMEANGSGERYGFDDRQLHQLMLAHDFQAADYDPFSRKLTLGAPQSGGNTLYIRNYAQLEKRVSEAPRITLNQVTF